MTVTYESYLCHHGVKGMKWGVRRYQNEDGSLTREGRKRAKQYKKLAVDVQNIMIRNNMDRDMSAHNRVADRMNNGLIEKYNSEWEKKHGNDYKSQEYTDKYFEYCEKLLNQEITKANLAVENSAEWKKAKAFADKYEMMSWNQLAKDNAEAMTYLRERVASFNDDIDW